MRSGSSKVLPVVSPNEHIILRKLSSNDSLEVIWSISQLPLVSQTQISFICFKYILQAKDSLHKDTHLHLFYAFRREIKVKTVSYPESLQIVLPTLIHFGITYPKSGWHKLISEFSSQVNPDQLEDLYTVIHSWISQNSKTTSFIASSLLNGIILRDSPIPDFLISEILQDKVTLKCSLTSIIKSICIAFLGGNENSVEYLKVAFDKLGPIPYFLQSIFEVNELPSILFPYLKEFLEMKNPNAKIVKFLMQNFSKILATSLISKSDLINKVINSQIYSNDLVETTNKFFKEAGIHFTQTQLNDFFLKCNDNIKLAMLIIPSFLSYPHSNSENFKMIMETLQSESIVSAIPEWLKAISTVSSSFSRENQSILLEKLLFLFEKELEIGHVIINNHYYLSDYLLRKNEQVSFGWRPIADYIKYISFVYSPKYQDKVTEILLRSIDRFTFPLVESITSVLLSFRNVDVVIQFLTQLVDGNCTKQIFFLKVSKSLLTHIFSVQLFLFISQSICNFILKSEAVTVRSVSIRSFPEFLQMCNSRCFTLNHQQHLKVFKFLCEISDPDLDADIQLATNQIQVENLLSSSVVNSKIPTSSTNPNIISSQRCIFRPAFQRKKSNSCRNNQSKKISLIDPPLLQPLQVKRVIAIVSPHQPSK